jgi:hypothetical protein
MTKCLPMIMLFIVILQWNPNPEPDLLGYHIYCDGKLVGTVPAGTTTFTHDPGGNLYVITAYSATAESPHSQAIIIGQVTIY